MSMVTLSWIAHTGYLLQEPQQNNTNPDLVEVAPPDKVQDTTMKTGTGEVVPGHNIIFTDITAHVIMTRTEAAPGHDIGIITATPGVACNAHAPHIGSTTINPTMTHYTDLITDNPHVEVPQPTTPEIIEDHFHIHSINPQSEIHTGHIPIQQIIRQTTPQEEPESDNRRSTHRLLQF